MQMAHTFEIERLTFYHNNFNFKSAADTSYDAMKARPKSVYQEAPSPAHSHLSNLPRLVPAHLSFRTPIDELKHCAERHGTHKPYHDHGSSEEDAGPVYPSTQDRPRCNTDDETNSAHGLCNHHGLEGVMQETSSLKRPRIDDPYSRAGHGHGAHVEYAGHYPPGQAKPTHRRHATARSSPTVCLPTIPQSSSLSTVSIVPTPEYNSNRSTLLVSACQSSADRYSQRDPTSLLHQDSRTATSSPSATIQSVNLSPQSLFLRGLVETNTSSGDPHPCKIAAAGKDSVSKPWADFLCNCCSSRPKKFDTAEELAAHQAKKQYGCKHCYNRFANQYEADRHEQTVHIRRRRWSCSNLSRYDQAFRESVSQPGKADVCGYCGAEFSRSGNCSGDILFRFPNEQDWDERGRHLHEAHKFRECNAAKKFYRADHMRQHNKRCHGATNSTWSNLLEIACLVDKSIARLGGRN